MIGLDILTPDYVNTRHNKTGRHLSIVWFSDLSFIFLRMYTLARAAAGIPVLQLPFCNIEANHAFGFQI